MEIYRYIFFNSIGPSPRPVLEMCSAYIAEKGYNIILYYHTWKYITSPRPALEISSVFIAEKRIRLSYCTIIQGNILLQIFSSSGPSIGLRWGCLAFISLGNDTLSILYYRIWKYISLHIFNSIGPSHGRDV